MGTNNSKLDRVLKLTCNTLAENEIYREYRTAFTQATGLPLRLRDAATAELGLSVGKDGSPFCILMARTNVSCRACLAVRQQMERDARLEPKTLKCFAGLCETAVPIRVEENVVGWLETGQVFVDHPTKSRFGRLAKVLLRWGIQVDLKEAEEAYFSTRVQSAAQYQSAVRLLQIFAEHLATFGRRLVPQQQDTEPPAVKRARDWIAQNSSDSVSLAAAAHSVNLSAKHFSDLFRHAVGIPFVDYVSRVRIEKAKTLLENPGRRVGEIAFEAGFQSLSQFNRVFRRHAGISPKGYRRSLLAQRPRPACRTLEAPNRTGDPEKCAVFPVKCVEYRPGNLANYPIEQAENRTPFIRDPKP